MSTDRPDRRAILAHLERAGDRPLPARELARALEVSKSSYRTFRRLLSDMEAKGEVFRQRGGGYGLPARFEAQPGRLQVTRGGDGFVILDEAGTEDVFVPARQLDTAQDGDRVVVRVDRRRPGRNPEGRIVRILERSVEQVVGTWHRHQGVGYVVPIEPPLRTRVLVAGDAAGDASEGDVVLVEIVDWGKGGPGPVGRVTRVLGRPGDPGVDVLAVLLGHQLPLDFPPDVVAEARRVARRGIRPEDLAQREDLRDRRTFTIDPADARDHDDALSARRHPDGSLEIGVHIADVSFYVKRGSALDREAAERATSIYLVDRVVPMLPEELSGGLCSLVPDEDRLVVSILYDVSADGAVRGRRIVRGVIRSAARLSYERAQALLEGTGRDGAAEGEDDLARTLSLLAGFARRLRARREAAGAIDFGLPEPQVELDARGEPVAIRARPRLEAHRLVEHLMILANETVAELGQDEDLPLVYRIHEPPDPERLEGLRSVAGLFGAQLPAEDVGPADIARLVQAQQGSPREFLVSMVALRSMRQARYSTRNAGHFGLASRAYAHFTSPIRRYPDLLVHRAIVRTLEGRTGRAGPDAEALEELARHCSVRERRAEEAERDSVELKTVRYMERHLGDEFEGTISGVTGFGLFVLLDEVLTEGLVRVSSLRDDYYVHDESTFTLTGRRSRRRFRLGDRVRVAVVRVDGEKREIDLDLREGPLDPADRTG
ncbi:MAG: ribonuclease R [Gemmatimonadota bacterium]|nr:ribonuclease R [Gemmatimonadota bacterium]